MDGQSREVPALEVIDLVKDYPRPVRGIRSFFLPYSRQGKVRALDGVSFAVRPGHVCGLLGTNGAGKTTLIKIAMNLLLPTSGTVRVMGREIEKNDTGARAGLGMVISEERSFYWRLSGRRNLEFFGALQGLDARSTAGRIEELGELLGMREYLDVPFSDYSAGMRQRMALARALLHDPALLLLDEPTHSLSPEAALPLQEFIRDRLVREEGKTVLLATQDMREAERLCQEVVILHRGRAVFTGPLPDLLEEGRREMGPGVSLEDLFIRKVSEAEKACAEAAEVSR